MSDRDAGERTGIAKWLNGTLFGVALLALAAAASAVQVYRAHRDAAPPGKKILRVAHWQLEAGYRDAIDFAIKEYEKLHPDVKVVQMAVTERVYQEWLNTQLIAGEAPDVVEIGKGKYASNEEYTVRFFRPMSDKIVEPNPYNVGTDLEGIPWKDTFLDGMLGGFYATYQDYYRIPSTAFVMRMFYNKDMLREATGSEEPPETFDELIRACDAVRELGRKKGVGVTPIVNCYYAGTFLDTMRTAFTASLEKELDLDLNGEISIPEAYAGFAAGQWDMQHPNVKGYFECARELCKQFRNDFNAMDRQTAMYLFGQEQACFLTTGSWDGSTVFKQGEGKFEIGVCQIPIPGKDNERWGQLIAGKPTEASQYGLGPYGIYSKSKHLDQAIDFLQFFTSQPYNGPIQEKASWAPIVIGSPASDFIKLFIPDPIGYLSRVPFDMANEVKIVFDGAQAQYLQGELSYEEFTKQYESILRHKTAGGDYVWAREYDTQQRNARNQERLLSIQALRMLSEPGADDAGLKYNRMLLQQTQGNNGEGTRYRFEQIRDKPIPKV